MAVTAILQRVTPHSLVYRVNTDVGGTLTIDSSGGATPDLATDVATVTGPIKRIGRAGLDGIGLIPAAGFDSVVKSDALLQDLDPTDVLGNKTVPRAIMVCQGKTEDNDWIITTSVAAGLPQITITHPVVGSDRAGVLMVLVPHTTSR